MIRKAFITDKNDFERLGTYINVDFDKLYNIDDLLKSSVCLIYVYIIDEKVIAFLHVNVLQDFIDVQNIAVEPAYRNRKIATKLFEYLFRNLPNNIKKITLEVNTNNKIALNLYKKLGFTTSYIRKKYYHNQDDAYVMERVI